MEENSAQKMLRDFVNNQKVEDASYFIDENKTVVMTIEIDDVVSLMLQGKTPENFSVIPVLCNQVYENDIFLESLKGYQVGTKKGMTLTFSNGIEIHLENEEQKNESLHYPVTLFIKDENEKEDIFYLNVNRDEVVIEDLV